MELAFFLIALAMSGIGIYFLGPSITGFIIKEFNYEQDLNLVVTANGNYTWSLENLGELKSIKIDGRVTTYGKAMVYIENNGIRYLIFDSTRLNESKEIVISNETSLITGFAAGADNNQNINSNNQQNDEERKKQNNKPDWTSGIDEFLINGTTSINLSEHFTDEDNDSLIYSASEVEGLDISIDGEIITLEPTSQDLNTTITFIASDGIDSKSEIVDLIVIAETKIGNNAPQWISEIETFIVNKTLSIDLSDYFKDDDNDTLTFNVSDADDVDEILVDNILNLSASKDNFNATITITASDGKSRADEDVMLIIPLTLVNETINETPIKSIKMNLSYNYGTIYDANDNGEESVNGVVDLSVANTKFSWDVDNSKLCTRWEIYNIEEDTLTTFCNGNNDCCAFAGLLPTKDSWNDIYYSTYGKDGAGYDNIAAAQVIYYDVNLSIENPKSDVYYSDWSNLSVKFYKNEVEFSDICEDTCAISGLNKSSYTLIFEVEDDTILRIDKIKYSLLVDVQNNPPILLQNFSNININKNQNFTINLSQYFDDPDNDNLIYDYYKMDNITMLFEGDTSTIVPDKDFAGERITLINANDSENNVVSNLFKIIVSEQNISEDKLIIQNLSGSTIAVFDSAGNVNIKGVLIEGIEPISDEDDFIVQNSSNGLNLVITNPEGIMLLKGNLNQNLNSSLIPTLNSFIIENSSRKVVSYVNSTGSLFLTGALTQNMSFG